MTESATCFEPDWVSPPGDTIADLLEERGWSQEELVQRIGYSPKHVSQLVNGKVSLSADAAVRLNSVLGGSVGFWLNREAQYRERLARLEARQQCANWKDWLEQIPVRSLMACGKIAKCRIDAGSKPAIVEQCLAFYGVASPDGWHARYGGLQLQFRRSRVEQSDLGAISAWLRMGEQEAEKYIGPRYDETTFRQALCEMRALSVLPPERFGPRLDAMFRASGVVFVLVPAIPKSHVSGVARWLDTNRPLIQLSLYGKTNDKFWFTLFHEVAHILLHGRGKKSKETVYLDDPDHAASSTDEEREANVWARDWLIPATAATELAQLRTKLAVQDFARQHDVHPAIVVGRLQHDGVIPPSWMNDLKISFRIADEG